MNRQLFQISAILGLGLITYSIKHHVLLLERQRSALQKELIQCQEDIYVLENEWCYLTRPERLEKLMALDRGLAALDSIELVSLEQAGDLTEPQDPLAGKVFYASLRSRGVR